MSAAGWQNAPAVREMRAFKISEILFGGGWEDLQRMLGAKKCWIGQRPVRAAVQR